MNKSLLKFMTGAAVGVGLSVAVNKYLKSDAGKKTTESARKMLSDFYDFVSPEIKMIKKLSQAKYKQIISAAAKEYGKIKKLSEDAVEDLVENTLSFWDDFLEKA